MLIPVPHPNILNSCPTQGRVEGWDAMKPLYYRSVCSKGAGRPRLTHHHKGWWNETKWMRWVWRNGGMTFVVGENGRNPDKNLPRSRFVHHETHVEGPRRELGTPAVGGERHEAALPHPKHSKLKVQCHATGRCHVSSYSLLNRFLIHNPTVNIYRVYQKVRSILMVVIQDLIWNKNS